MKKFILLSYYFPPCGGAGVQRWLRLLKYLPEYGWQPTVITTDDGDYPVRDESLLDHVPKRVKVIHTKTLSFGHMFRSMSGDQAGLPYGSLQTDKNDGIWKKSLFWIRLNLIFPDARVIWNHSCLKAALKELLTDKYSCVITTGPPQSTHLVGMKLKKAYHVKWIADFRDPWTKIIYLKFVSQNRLIKRLNLRAERKAVARADLNLVISQYISDSLSHGNKQVFWNGFDPSDFLDMKYERSLVFRIKYMGNLTDGQDIHQILKILLKWLVNNPKIHIEFSFLGTFQEIPKDIQAYGINIRNMAFMPHQEALKETVDAELLLLIINEYEGNEGMLTNKLFEYIGSRTPILCLGPLHGEAASIITKFKAGTVYDYTDENGVLNTLDSQYNKWNTGEDLRNTEDISELSAPVQAKKLSEILDKL